jgi:hypothetical protein
VAVRELEPGLFDSGSPNESVFFLTNRNNLLRIMATGMLMPHAGFAEKYYDDLLRLAPGRLPLLSSSASAELVSMVTPEPQAFPVMLELMRTGLADSAFPSLMIDGVRDRAGWANPSARMWAPSGALVLADTVTAIHFRTDAERDEFEVRDFADVRPRTNLHRITPHLFEGDGPPADTVTEWLGSLEPLGEPSPEDISAADRRSGAVLLGCLTAIPTKEELWGWGQLLAGRKIGRQAGGYVSRIGRVLDGATKARDPEDVALQVCIEELSVTNRLEVWRPIDVLDRIRDKLIGQLNKKADPMKPALDRAAAILRDEEAFEGLKTGGSPVLKALLLTLKRPEPQRLIGWDPGGPGSTPEVLNLAAVMVGALTGRALIPIALRDAPLDHAASRVEADRLSTARDRAMPLFKPLSVDVDRVHELLRLQLSGNVVIDRVIAQPALHPASIDSSLLSDVAVRAKAIEIALQHRWADAVESIVEAPTAQLITLLPHIASPTMIRFSGIGSLRFELLTEQFLAHVERGELSLEEQGQLSTAQPQRPASD